MSATLVLITLSPNNHLAGVRGDVVGVGAGVPLDLSEPEPSSPLGPSSYQPTDNPFEAVSLRALLRGRDLDAVGLMESSRIHRWLRLRDRSIRRVLNNSRDSWLLYRRMHPQLAASIVAPASVPGTNLEQEERLDFRHLLRSMVLDINNGKHDHGAEFLRYLALLNGDLASYLLAQTSKQAMNLLLDDFIVRFGFLSEKSGTGEVFSDLRFHPALRELTHESRELLIDNLLDGWVTSTERDLAVHLDSLNYPSQVER